MGMEHASVAYECCMRVLYVRGVCEWYVSVLHVRGACERCMRWCDDAQYVARVDAPAAGVGEAPLEIWVAQNLVPIRVKLIKGGIRLPSLVL
jgi:hypothetical protein